ncbi:MAG: 16S rRNA (guanine(966)-N(2))-methyltransferase RsmD [Desulfuromonadales bacterium]
MRVIAGTSRGRRLVPFTGGNIRPTPDRVREALFSILQSKLGRFEGLKVLDLFAGSGALAIEALSRGAFSACLVEMDMESVKVIRSNLARCRMTNQAQVVVGNAWQALQQFGPDSFDLIFIDPPYDQGLAEQALGEVDRLRILTERGILCAETRATESLAEKIGHLSCIDQRRYGTTVLNFYSYTSESLS